MSFVVHSSLINGVDLNNEISIIVNDNTIYRVVFGEEKSAAGNPTGFIDPNKVNGGGKGVFKFRFSLPTNYYKDGKVVKTLTFRLYIQTPVDGESVSISFINTIMGYR